MSNNTYICYVCGNEVMYNSLAYKCMCIHPNDSVKYRGICNVHNPLPDRSLWKENPDSNHHLNKIYKPTDEEKALWDAIDKNIPE